MQKLLTATLFLMFGIGSGFNSFAQSNDGVLRLFVLPKPETIMINDSVLKYGNKITLPAGTHQVKLWSPSFTLLDTTIVISANTTYDFFYKQVHSEDYYAYEKRYSDYKKRRRLHYNVPLISTLLFTGASIFTYVDASNTYKEVGVALEDYKFTTHKLNQKYDAYLDVSKQYRTKRVLFYTSVGLTAVSGYFLYKGYKWRKKNPAEEYKSGENPLTFNNIYLLPTAEVKGGYSLGIVFNFKH